MPRSEDVQHSIWHDAADDPRAAYERHPVEDLEPLPERDCTACGEHHLRLLIWMSAPFSRRRSTTRKVYQRAAVYVWLLAPHLLPWRTVHDMARGIGLSLRQTHDLLRSLRSSRSKSHTHAIGDGVPTFSNQESGRTRSPAQTG